MLINASCVNSMTRSSEKIIFRTNAESLNFLRILSQIYKTADCVAIAEVENNKVYMDDNFQFENFLTVKLEMQYLLISLC